MVGYSFIVVGGGDIDGPNLNLMKLCWQTGGVCCVGFGFLVPYLGEKLGVFVCKISA